MCGRFANSYSLEKMLAHYQVQPVTIQWQGSYNICPTELAPIIREQGGYSEVSLAKFGMPMTMNGKTFPLINLQSEKVRNRKDFALRRCIIPASGFFEWEKITPKDKQPYFFSANEGSLSFAGVWNSNGDTTSFSILTTTANDLLDPIHKRMPVI